MRRSYPQPGRRGHLARIRRERAFDSERRQAVYAPAPAPTYASIVLADSPLAYWRLGDPGSSVTDFSGHGLAGTVSGSVTQDAGVTPDGDTAMTFDGLSGQVSVAGFPASAAWSLECWFKVPTLQAGLPRLLAVPLGNLFFYGSDQGSAGYLQWNSNGPALSILPGTVDGNWHHCVVTFDGTTGSMYNNGSQADSAVAAFGGFAAGTVNIASAGGSSFLAGSMDEVAIYGYALSASQVLTHYNAARTSTSYSRTATENVGPASDAVAQTLAYARGVTETLTSASDAAARVLIEGRAAIESVSAGDIASRTASSSRQTAESLAAATDAASRTVAIGRQATETVGAASDSAARSFAGTRQLSESVSASDSAGRTLRAARGTMESTTAADTLARGYRGSRTGSEAVGAATDAPARLIGYPRQASEAVAATDVTSRTSGVVRQVSKSVGPGADSVSESHTGGSTINESVGPSADTLARRFTGARGPAESVSASDTVARAADHPRATSEASTASDTTSRLASQTRATSDTVGPGSASVGRSTVQGRSAAEGGGPGSDTVGRSGRNTRSSSENVGPGGDALNRQLAQARATSEGGSSSDAPTWLLTVFRQLTEAVSPALDTASLSTSWPRLIGETQGPAVDTPSHTGTGAPPIHGPGPDKIVLETNGKTRLIFANQPTGAPLAGNGRTDAVLEASGRTAAPGSNRTTGAHVADNGRTDVELETDGKTAVDLVVPEGNYRP
jgi:hypothetical protein